MTPLRDAVDGQDQSFRLLCGTCHREVTDVVTKRSPNPILSVFKAKTYKDFIESPSPVQFVLPIGKIDPEAELVYLDVKRCRRSCLVDSTVPWPVLCAHDAVHEVASEFFQS